MAKNNKDNPSKYAQLFAISTQMAASIIGFAIVGYLLDNYYAIEENYFTLGCFLLGVFVGLYLLMRGIQNLQD